MKFHENPSSGRGNWYVRGNTYGLTDMTKLQGACRPLANAPNVSPSVIFRRSSSCSYGLWSEAKKKGTLPWVESQKPHTQIHSASRITFPSKAMFPTLATSSAVGPSVSISGIVLGIKAKHLSPSFTISPWSARKKTLWSIIRLCTYWENFRKTKHYINLSPNPQSSHPLCESTFCGRE